jgi:hypothetical protein
MIFRGDMLHPRWSQLVLLSSNTGIIPQGKWFPHTQLFIHSLIYFTVLGTEPRPSYMLSKQFTSSSCCPGWSRTSGLKQFSYLLLGSWYYQCTPPCLASPNCEVLAEGSPLTHIYLLFQSKHIYLLLCIRRSKAGFSLYFWDAGNLFCCCTSPKSKPTQLLVLLNTVGIAKPNFNLKISVL